MYEDEKRRHQRIEPLDLTYVLIDSEGSHVGESTGRVINVSESGICLEISISLMESQFLLLAIAFKDVLVEVKCKVIHCSEGIDDKYKIGVEVLDTDGAFGEAVRDFITYFREEHGQKD